MGLIKATEIPISLGAFSLKDIEAQATAILLGAKEKAERIIAAAQGEAEALQRVSKVRGLAEGLKLGKAQGIEEGKKAGHEAALAEHSTAVTQLVQSLQKAVAELEEHRDQLLTRGLREVVDLACAVARRVTKRQGKIDPEVLTANLKDAMSLAVHAADVRVALHPSQMKTLQDELPNLRLAWPQLKHIELVEDPAISPGGVKVHTAHGRVDGDLGAQLDRIVAELMPDRAAGMQ